MKKYNKLIISIVAVCAMILVSAYLMYAWTVNNSAEAASPSMFSVIEHCGYNSVVLVDNDTGVMYYCTSNGVNQNHLTLLVDAQGNPKLYNKN